MKDIVIKKSKIHGKGVFANKNFKKGEIILKWKPKVLKKQEIEKLSDKEKRCLYRNSNRDYFLMQAPEKYINHSCNANTEAKNQCDVAIRDIRKGEEITSDYSDYNKKDSSVGFECKCSDKNCKKTIKY